MNILVTGAFGFIGKSLVESLKDIKNKKDRTRSLTIDEIYECGRATPDDVLSDFCKSADFVFCLAGANRPSDPEDFIRDNVENTSKLLKMLSAHGNTCPVMYASSTRAENDDDYGKSKREAEKLMFSHAAKNGAKVLVYRFPNVFGMGCRPNYNSVIATFCHNIANGLPIRIDDPETKLELCYIDDLVCEMLDALEGNEHRHGEYCVVSKTHRAKLGHVAELLYGFALSDKVLNIPPMPRDSLDKKLYSTYLSYLPPEKMRMPLKKITDHRGSFSELIKTADCGQISVNVVKPGEKKGGHRHRSKCEVFIAVSGRGLIRQRKAGSDAVYEFEVSGESPEAVYILPGYTHEIVNLSDTIDLVTLIWANECFDPMRPDTFSDPV